MNLGDYIRRVAGTYNRHEGVSGPGALLLAECREHLAEHIPVGMQLYGGRGIGVAPIVPWFALLDPDETSTPTRGLYIVFLFAADSSKVFLSLNQGCTQLRQSRGDRGARDQLVAEAVAIRSALPPNAIVGLHSEISLESSAALPRFYEAGNIAAIEYITAALPDESVLRADLQHFVELYTLAIDAKRDVLQANPGVIETPSPPQTAVKTDNPLRGFKPKDSGDYIQQLQGRLVIKSRRHEAIVKSFAEWATEFGFEPHSPHPRDLVLLRENTEWLIEAKVIRNGNAATAVREAVGQLLDYQYFLYEELGKAKPAHLVGLFSEATGEAYVAFLEAIGIVSVWWEDGRWNGSSVAKAEGLVSPA